MWGIPEDTVWKSWLGYGSSISIIPRRDHHSFRKQLTVLVIVLDGWSKPPCWEIKKSTICHHKTLYICLHASTFQEPPVLGSTRDGVKSVIISTRYTPGRGQFLDSVLFTHCTTFSQQPGKSMSPTLQVGRSFREAIWFVQGPFTGKRQRWHPRTLYLQNLEEISGSIILIMKPRL